MLLSGIDEVALTYVLGQRWFQSGRRFRSLSKARWAIPLSECQTNSRIGAPRGYHRQSSVSFLCASEPCMDQPIPRQPLSLLADFHSDRFPVEERVLRSHSVSWRFVADTNILARGQSDRPAEQATATPGAVFEPWLSPIPLGRSSTKLLWSNSISPSRQTNNNCDGLRFQVTSHLKPAVRIFHEKARHGGNSTILSELALKLRHGVTQTVSQLPCRPPCVSLPLPAKLESTPEK